MMRAALNEYALFQGISAEDLKVLLPCIKASLVDLREGQTLRLEPEHAALVLSGQCTAQSIALPEESGDSPLDTSILGPDSVLLRDAPAMLSASEGCLLLKMDRYMMFSPCWFSCSFHHLLISNADLLAGQRD